MNQQKKITSMRQSKVSAIIMLAYYIVTENTNSKEKPQNKKYLWSKVYKEENTRHMRWREARYWVNERNKHAQENLISKDGVQGVEANHWGGRDEACWRRWHEGQSQWGITRACHQTITEAGTCRQKNVQTKRLPSVPLFWGVTFRDIWGHSGICWMHTKRTTRIICCRVALAAFSRDGQNSAWCWDMQKCLWRTSAFALG